MIDENDGRLLASVRPPDYRNPSPAPMYDLVVIGGGTAGLVSAAGAAGLGARVALVEKNRLGGDCLNTGCVPSKALLRSARVAYEARRGPTLGVAASAQPDFAAVMARMRARRADLAPNDSAERFGSLGVDVFFGTASFLDGRSIRVARPGGDPVECVLRFKKAVIATGSRPTVPDIPGLAEAGYLTSDTLFDLTDQPREMAVIGGGPVGCEMAQAFAGLGTTVTLIESGPRILPRDDPDASALVLERLRGDGVRVHLGAAVHSVRRENGRRLVVHGAETTAADAILVATGRARVTSDLNLAAAGVDVGPAGPVVDDFLRTRNPRVYAAGDVGSPVMFTHVADEMARVVIQNALILRSRRVSRLVVPWCTFTDPEVAHVGLMAEAARAEGASTITVPLSEVDRAVLDEAPPGFVRVHHRRRRILGVTIVAPGAGELIGLAALAMTRAGGGLDSLASSIFPYPTMSLGLRRAADQYRRQRLTPIVRRLLRYYFSVSR